MVMSVGWGTGGGRCSDDDARFTRLYTRCYEPIRAFCSRRVAADAVDDAVADTFLTVWRRLDEVPAGEAALVWIYAVAFRVIGHQWRATARRGRLQHRLRTVEFRPVSGADEATLDRDEHRLVLAALSRLGDTDAEMLRLVAWEQLSVVDVAAVLGIEPDAARQRLHRARRNLAIQFDRIQARTPSTPAACTGGAR
jgi:RNA polymerase sigma-70 factor (ECF subfamily)